MRCAHKQTQTPTSHSDFSHFDDRPTIYSSHSPMVRVAITQQCFFEVRRTIFCLQCSNIRYRHHSDSLLSASLLVYSFPILCTFTQCKQASAVLIAFDCTFQCIKRKSHIEQEEAIGFEAS